MLEIVNVNSKYRMRCKEVKTKFACYEIREMPMTTGVSLPAYRQYVSQKIREMLDKTLRKGMAEKKTLSQCREFKEVRGTIDHLYDNTIQRGVDYWRVPERDVCKPGSIGRGFQTSERLARNAARRKLLKM